MTKEEGKEIFLSPFSTWYTIDYLAGKQHK
jgi:hypothetical protein